VCEFLARAHNARAPPAQGMAFRMRRETCLPRFWFDPRSVVARASPQPYGCLRGRQRVRAELPLEQNTGNPSGMSR
jgi:hypothetical protein